LDYTNIIQDNAITVRTYRSVVVNFVHGKSRKIFLLQVKLITCGRSVWCNSFCCENCQQVTQRKNTVIIGRVQENSLESLEKKSAFIAQQRQCSIHVW